MPKNKTSPAQKKIVFLLGPTGIGKSAAAVCLAKKIAGEIVSCDSMQVYRRMDILTSLVSPEQRKTVKHHLLKIIEPSEEFNVAQYRKKALAICRSLHKKGKVPLFTGGSGLYYSVIVDGLFPSVPADAKVRAKLEAQLKSKGSGYLYGRLKKADLEAALKIHPHDSRRIIRALEVYIKSGKPISSWQKERCGLGKEYGVKAFALNLNRPELYAKINQRVERMFEEGVVEEVRKLLRKKLSRTARCAIGLPEISGFLKGDYPLEEACRLMQRNSRHYAKRQFTWFKKDKRIKWVNIKDKEEPAAIAGRIYRQL